MRTISLLMAAVAGAMICRPNTTAREPVPPASHPVIARRLLEAPDAYLTHGTATLRYRVIGDGDPVLLLHGVTDRLELWTFVADSLARDFRVIVPDLRGAGASSTFSDPASFGLPMVEDVSKLLDHLNAQGVHIMGYSTGAVVGAQLALREPARVASATFVGGAFWPDSAALARRWAPFVRDMEEGRGLASFLAAALPTWPSSMIDSLLPVVEGATDAASLTAFLRGFPVLMPDSQRVAAATVPALSFAARPDPHTSGARWVARFWPGMAYVEIPGRDHSDLFNAPELLVAFRSLVARSVQAP